MPITPPQAGPLAPGSRARALLLTGFLLPQAWAAAPEILTPPQPAEISYRDSAALTVQATGDGVSLQWYAGTSGDLSAPVPGATGPFLLSQPLLTTNSFWVRASNADGHTDSPAATVTVRPPVSGRLMGMGMDYEHNLFADGGDSRVPRFIFDGATAVSTNHSHTLFTRADRSLWGMGYNGFRQLSPEEIFSIEEPQQLTTGVVHASAGTRFTLYIREDASLWGLGANGFGQLGSGTMSSSLPAYQIASSVVDAAAGGDHSAYVTSDGGLWTTGRNQYGQLGDGSIVGKSTYARVANGVARVYPGATHTLFIKTDGSLWGMGWNEFGQLGDGSITNRSSPVKIADGVISAAAGSGHSLYRTVANEMFGIGWARALGPLWNGQTQNITTPAPIAQGVKSVACGNSHSLYITADNTLHTMGDNQFGQLGDGNWLPRYVPHAAGSAIMATAWQHHTIFLDASPLISDQPDTTAIVSRKKATLSVTAEGEGPFTYQWYLGQPGDISQPVEGATADRFTTPALTANTTYWVRVTNPYGSVDSAAAEIIATTKPLVISLPGQHAVPHLGNAVIYAEVSGQALSYQWYQGKKGNTSRPVIGATSPMLVTPPLTASTTYWLRATNVSGKVNSAPVTVTVAAAPRGTLYGTGHNMWGQLGIGTNVRSFEFQQVESDVTAISASGSSSFFLKPDGSLRGMGYNTYGELGDGSTVNRNLPVPLGKGMLTTASHGNITYYLQADGSLWHSGRLNQNFPPTLITTPEKIGEGFASIRSGGGFILAVKTDGTLWGRGSNGDGQLGQGQAGTSSYANFVKIADEVVQAAAGRSHSLYIKRDGSLWGMGYSATGQLGPREWGLLFYTPIQIVPSGVTGIAASRESIFLKEDGTCWGMGGSLNPGSDVPVQLATEVSRVGSGDLHLSYLKSNHELWVVGENRDGQLGDGTNTTRTAPVMVRTGVVAFSGGSAHSLILTGHPVIAEHPESMAVKKGTRTTLTMNATSGVPVTWQWYLGESGDISNPIPGAVSSTYRTPVLNEALTLWARATNEYGSSDSGSLLIQAVTKPVIASIPANTSVTYGELAALPVSASGGELTYEWFEGPPGKTSKPVITSREPILITRPLRASTKFWVRVSNAAGKSNSRAIPVSVLPRVAGTLKTFGRNQSGQLGNGSIDNSLLPYSVSDGVVQVTASPGNTYFLKNDGTLWGVGDGSLGQLGLPVSNELRLLPVQIATGVTDMVAGGGGFLLFIKTDRSLWGLGVNNRGQLGLGDTEWRSVPALIATDVVQAAAGASHTVFVKSDGSAWTTGTDSDGELGNGQEISGNILTPAKVMSGVASVAAGQYHTILLKHDGSLWATGYNGAGQLGDGTTLERASFVPAGTGIRAIACGAGVTLVRKLDDSLWKLGETNTLIATNVQSMAAGAGHQFYITSAGQLYGWGNNHYGQLGDGSTTAQPTPVLLGSAQAAACGYDHSAVIVQEAAAGATANATGRAGTIPDPDGDSDGDGLSNLLEHAFASDTLAPGVPPYTLALQTTGAGAALVLTHRRAIGAAVDFIYEWSDDLADWQAFTPQFQVQPVDAEAETVIATRPIAPGEPAIFLRVRVREK